MTGPSNYGFAQVAPLPQRRLMLMVVRNDRVLPECNYIFWLSTQFGVTERVSTFRKEGKNQIVVQFQNAADCAGAINYLNSRELPEVGVLKCVSSKMDMLTFRNNDSRNRDYTGLNMLIAKVFQSGMTREQAWETWRQFGGPPDMGVFPFEFVWGQHHFGGGWLYPAQSPNFQGVLPTGASQGSVQAENGGEGGCLHVCGLPEDEDLFGAEHLFKLFGMIGNVCGARVLANHPGCAVIQFESQAEASLVLSIMMEAGEPLQLRGKTVKVQHSRQRRTMVPQLTADVRRVCTRQDCGLVPFLTEAETHAPSRFLYFWDVPREAGERAERVQRGVKQLVRAVTGIEGYAVAVVNCVVHEDSARQGLCCVTVECKSTDDAIMTACALNGLNDEWTVKLRFAADLSPLPPGTPLHERGQQRDVPPPPPPPPGASGQDFSAGINACAGIGACAGINACAGIGATPGHHHENVHPGYPYQFMPPPPPHYTIPPGFAPEQSFGWNTPSLEPCKAPPSVPPQMQAVVQTPPSAPPPSPPLTGLIPMAESDEDSIGPEEGDADLHARRHPKTPAVTSSSTVSAFHTSRTRSFTPPARSPNHHSN